MYSRFERTQTASLIPSKPHLAVRSLDHYAVPSPTHGAVTKSTHCAVPSTTRSVDKKEPIPPALARFQEAEREIYWPRIESLNHQLTPEQERPIKPLAQQPNTSKMSDKIKCTYEECFKHFKTEAAMKKHKEKDSDHFYCRRCDLDCEDDTEFLIHQIISPRHIACPTCGAEFEGNSARDLHVEVRHKKKQALQCVGCGSTLVGASTYIAHIAKGECEVITLEAFDRLRAERQIEKDAWEAALDTQNVTYGDSNRMSNADTNGGAPLMDEDYRGMSNGQRNTSDLDSHISPLQPTPWTSQPATSKLASSMAKLSVDRYPPLEPQSKSAQPTAKDKNVPQKAIVEDGDLLDFESEFGGQPKLHTQQQATGAWVGIGSASKALFPPKADKSYPSQSDLSGITTNTTHSNPTHATYGNDTNLPNSSAGRDRTLLPPTAHPVDTDPNAQFRGVKTGTRVVPHSVLDPMRYYDDIQLKFICTGATCKRQFDTAEGFKAHLVTDAHVGGKTQCPSCLKKFATTWALIAHCESPSRKCRISKSAQYNQILRELTAGLLGTEGHTDDGTGDVRYVANPVDDWVEDRVEKKAGFW